MQVRCVTVGHEPRVKHLCIEESRGPAEPSPLSDRRCVVGQGHRNFVQDDDCSMGQRTHMTSSSDLTILGVPVEERRFPNGLFEVFEIGGLSIGRAVYEPGWRWSEHVAPTAGTPWCEVEHVGLVLSGRAAVQMRDGSEAEMGPGEFFSIPAGHDSWVLGDEEYVSLHFHGAQGYASPTAGIDGGAEGTAVVRAIDSESAPWSSWAEGCDGWTLLSRPALHVMQERMAPGTREYRHLSPTDLAAVLRPRGTGIGRDRRHRRRTRHPPGNRNPRRHGTPHPQRSQRWP